MVLNNFLLVFGREAYVRNNTDYGNHRVNFPISFTKKPVVIGGISCSVNYESGYCVRYDQITSTYFHFKCYGDYNSNHGLSYIAIGI